MCQVLAEAPRSLDIHCSIPDLVPHWEVSLGPLVLGAWSISHWTTREVPGNRVFADIINLRILRRDHSELGWPLIQ